MALEYYIEGVDGDAKLQIEVNTQDFKGLIFGVKKKGKKIMFSTIDLNEILELGLMVNKQIGVEIFNILRIEAAIQKEEKQLNSQ